MVQMKKRHLRGQTDVHIPASLIGFIRSQAKPLLHTDQKVELKLEGCTMRIDPLWLTFNPPPAIAEKLDLYMTREEMIKLEKDIIDTQSMIKQLTIALVKNGSPDQIPVILEKMKSGELDLEGLKAAVEALEPKNEPDTK